MRGSDQGGGIRMGWGVFLACWAAAAAVALALGRDANWDLRNYHLHNPWALLERRWGMDLVPAGPHSFLHPGLDLPFHLLTQGPLNHWPRAVAALQAAPLGLLAFLTLAIANLACHGEARRLQGPSLLVAGFGLTGAATLPEAGTSFNDIPVACLVVGALLLLLAAGAEDAARSRRARRLRLAAGALGGAAAALKLTALIFPPALALAAALGTPPGAANRIRAVPPLAAGWAAGFALVYGPWGWFLWKRFGNPFGPFLNEIFGSPWFPPHTARDPRFLPDGVGEALAYPLLWARRSEWLVTEWPVADPRFAVGLAALLLTAAIGGWRNLRAHPTGAAAKDVLPEAARRGTRAVMGFVLAGYLVWLAAFAILRYAIAVEVLLGVPVWAAARAVLAGDRGQPRSGAPLRRRGTALCMGAALGTCALVTLYPEWDRQPFLWPGEPPGAMAVAVAPAPLPEGSLVAMLGPAVSFTAPSLAGPGIRFLGAPHPGWVGDAAYRTGLAEAVREAVRGHRGPAFAVVEDPDEYDREVAEAYGIALDLAACGPLPNNLTTLVRLCRLR